MKNKKPYRYWKGFRHETDQAIIDRFDLLKDLGIREFKDSHLLRTNSIDRNDIASAKRVAVEGITLVNPVVFSLFFEHLFLASELGKRIVEKLGVKSYKLGVRKAEVEFLLWFHDIGRLVNPTEYMRTDVVNSKLLSAWGIEKKFTDELPPVETILRVGAMIRCDDEQLQGLKPLNFDQEKILNDYFNLLTPTQKIISLADNLGKRNDAGKLFDLKEFLAYLRSQESLYGAMSPWRYEDWATERRPAGALVSVYIVEKTVDWLEGLGVNLDEILKSMENYGPKFIIVARHGELYNPKNILYNRDEVMKPEDVIHLSDYGREQMKILGELIQKRKFRVDKIITSPSIRAVESGSQLNLALNIAANNIASDRNLDDVYAPGGYIEGMTMDQFKALGGDAYDDRWKKYKHELPDSTAERMKNAFWQMVDTLSVGETGLIVSHGDPIAIWIQYMISGKVPLATNLRYGIYSDKGEAIIVIIDPEGKWFSHYFLKDPSLKEGEMY